MEFLQRASTDPSTAEVALKIWARLGMDAEFPISLLRHPSPAVREGAIRALASYPALPPGALPPILDVFRQGNDIQVRASAGEALLGIQCGDSLPLIQAMIAATLDPHWRIRKIGVQALGDISIPQNLLDFIRFLLVSRAYDADPSVAASSLISLGKIGERFPTPREIIRIAAALLVAEETGDHIKGAATAMLMRAGKMTPQAHQALQNAFHQGGWKARREIVSRLDPDLPWSRDILISALRDSSEEVRYQAAVAAVRFPSQEVLEAIANRWEKKSPSVKKALLDTLREMGRAALPDKAIAIAVAETRNPDPGVRGAAARLLEGMNTPSALGALTGMLRDPMYSVRVQAAASLRKCPLDPGFWTGVSAQLEGDDALSTLSALDILDIPIPDDVGERVAAFLSDSNPESRALAASVLGKAGPSWLEDLLRAAAMDPAAEVRREAMASIRAMADRGVPVDQRVVATATFAVRWDQDLEVRRAALRVLGHAPASGVDLLKEACRDRETRGVAIQTLGEILVRSPSMELAEFLVGLSRDAGLAERETIFQAIAGAPRELAIPVLLEVGTHPLSPHSTADAIRVLLSMGDEQALLAARCILVQMIQEGKDQQVLDVLRGLSWRHDRHLRELILK